MNLLAVAGVDKRRGGAAVLRGLDLSVPLRAIVALLGPSGCGKTTLLRLIAGFETADAGRIALDGRVLQGPGAFVAAERRQIGYVPQEGTLFPHLTVEGNVGFGLSRAERRTGRGRGIRTNCRAGSSSGRRWRGRWRRGRRWCCWTSRSPGSISGCGAGCAPTWSGCCGSPGRRRSW